MKFPIRTSTHVKNFSNPESFEKSLEQNAASKKLTPESEARAYAEKLSWTTEIPMDVVTAVVSKFGIPKSEAIGMVREMYDRVTYPDEMFNGVAQDRPEGHGLYESTEKGKVFPILTDKTRLSDPGYDLDLKNSLSDVKREENALFSVGDIVKVMGHQGVARIDHIQGNMAAITWDSLGHDDAWWPIDEFDKVPDHILKELKKRGYLRFNMQNALGVEVPIITNAQDAEIRKFVVVVVQGGSIGQKEWQSEPLTEVEAKEKAKRMTAQLSKGEKEYYKIRYKVKKV